MSRRPHRLRDSPPAPQGVLRAVILGGLLAAMAVPGLGDPTDPRVAIQGLELDGPELKLSFRLDNAFHDNLRRGIDSGLPTGFTFDFQLARPRKGWFNNTLDSVSLQVDAMYNAVTREYLINYRLEGSLIESRVIREPDELRRAMTEFTDFRLFSVDGRPAGQRLRVRVRADLGTGTFFFFIPRTLSTDWASRRFRIAGGDGDGSP